MRHQGWRAHPDGKFQGGRATHHEEKSVICRFAVTAAVTVSRKRSEAFIHLIVTNPFIAAGNISRKLLIQIYSSL